MVVEKLRKDVVHRMLTFQIGALGFVGIRIGRGMEKYSPQQSV